MASRPRFRSVSPRTPRTQTTSPTEPSPSWGPGDTHLLLQTLVNMQQTSMNMQRQTTQRPQTPSVPSSAAPEKCEAEMSTVSFCSWRRSVERWVELQEWGPPKAVLCIRLCCILALQRIIDTRYSMDQWKALAVADALDAIERLVLKGTNQAVTWTAFFSSYQAPGESVLDFFRQCSQLAADCKFQCPNCHSDLSEYMLLRKLMGG